MPVKLTRTLTLDNKEVTLVASFRGMQKIEELTGTGLIAILQRASKKDVRITDLAAVIYGGMYGNPDIKGKDRLSFDTIGELITSQGHMKIATDVLLFLSDIVMAGHEEQPAGEAMGSEAAREHG